MPERSPICSPEQAEGRTVDARSDIFAFGCVLYEMLTGRRAFTGDTPVSTLAAILRDEPKPVSELAARVPVELQNVVSRCLRKDPERRFQHMADVRIELLDVSEKLDQAGRLEQRQAAANARSLRVSLASCSCWWARPAYG